METDNFDIPTDHEEFVHDIAFDFYCQRIATCSSDLTIKIQPKNAVYDYCEEESKWKNTASIKAHEGPIWRVQWADPAFGQVLVSCSADKSIKFFVEKEPETHKWTHAFQFTNLKECSDVQFAPKRFGFILAACQKDKPGTLSVFGPSSRAVLDTCVVKAHTDANSNGCNALCWDPDATEANQMIVVGCKMPSKEINKEESKSGIQDLVKVYSYSAGKLNHLINLYSEEGHKDSVTDVSWAPQSGRANKSYIATGGLDKKVIIWSLEFNNTGSKVANLDASFSIIRIVKDYHEEIRCLKWNFTGTKLVTLSQKCVAEV